MPANEMSPINTPQSVNPMTAVVAGTMKQQKEQQHKKREKPIKKHLKDYFRPLSKAIEVTNQRLVERKLPYRFRVFKRWGDVFIELSTLNENGSIREKQVKNISYDDFNRIIDDIASIEGLFLDYQA